MLHLLLNETVAGEAASLHAKHKSQPSLDFTTDTSLILLNKAGGIWQAIGRGKISLVLTDDNFTEIRVALDDPPLK